MGPMHPLREHRHRRAWSMDDVAERLIRLGREEGVRGLATSGTTVGRWERGECKPRHPYPRLLCILFEATPAELGLAPSPHSLSCDTLETVERRRVLGLLAGAVAAPVLVRGRVKAEVRAEAERLVHALGRPSKTDGGAVAVVEAGIAAARRIDDVSGPRVAVQAALEQWELVQTLLRGRPPAPVARRLTLAGAELSQLLGWLAYDMNDPATSLAYLDKALRMAHEVDAHDLGAYVLGHRSIVEMAEGRPQKGLAFAETARSWGDAKGTAAMRSWLAMADAETRAKLGDRNGAERALDGARTALARSRPEDEPPWIYFWDEAVLDARTGRVHISLGLTKPARAAVQRALAKMDASMVRDRALDLSKLGETYAVDAEVGEACRLGGQALAIATATRSDRAVLRVRQLRAQLAPWESESMVRDLDDQLAATTAWCRSAVA